MDKSKLLGIGLTGIGVILIAIGLMSETAVDAFNIFWMATAAALITGLLLLRGKAVSATYFARIIVGAIFLVSGLIKANDTMGFGFKLEEYFDENVVPPAGYILACAICCHRMRGQVRRLVLQRVVCLLYLTDQI